MALPDLRRLALGAPTGASLLLEGLPPELRRLITEQLLVATDQPTLCASLQAWCEAHPVACLVPGLWRAAFVVAFGAPAQEAAEAFDAPLEEVADWRGLFEETCAALEEAATGWPSVAENLRGVAGWADGRLDAFLYWFENPRDGDNPPYIAPLARMLRVRGAVAERHRERVVDMHRMYSALSTNDAEEVRYNLYRGLVTHTNYVDMWGLTMMCTLAYLGRDDPDLMRELLRSGGQVYINHRKVDDGKPDPPNYAMVANPFPYGQTPLFRAIQSSHVESVRVLIDHGADLNMPCARWSSDDSPSTPLEEARRIMQKWTQPRPARIIVPRGRPRRSVAVVQLLEAAIAAREAAAGP